MPPHDTVSAMTSHTYDADMLTVPQVAVELGVSRTQVYRLIEAGVLRTVKTTAPGSLTVRQRITRADLQKYVSSFTDR